MTFGLFISHQWNDTIMVTFTNAGKKNCALCINNYYLNVVYVIWTMSGTPTDTYINMLPNTVH